MLLELLLLLSVLVVWAVMRDRKPSDMPPGPLEIPFIGHPPVQFTKQIENYRKKYGNIFSTRLGHSRTLFISDYSVAKALYASHTFDDRPAFFNLFDLDSTVKGGVITSKGIHWVHDRRFVLRNLKNLGMGKTYLEQAIHLEAQSLVDEIKSFAESPVIPVKCIRTAMLNVVWQMVASKRYEHGSSEVDKIFTISEEFRDESFLIFIDHFFPILNVIPKTIKDRLLRTHVLEEVAKEVKKIIGGAIKEHQSTEGDHQADLISEYLLDMDKHKDEPDSLFSLGALQQIVNDLFGAGTETVTNTLKWVIYYMLTCPEKTRICQQQIDDVVPSDRLVSVTNRAELPYVDAFVSEVMRHSSMLYMCVQRTAKEDTVVMGYRVPKGTHIAMNAYFIHHDPAYWEDPLEFRPERFIDENGNFQSKLGRSVFFGAGRRQCAGEALARMEVHLFAAAMLQHFTVELPPGSTFDPAIVEGKGMRVPVHQQLLYRNRHPAHE